MLFNHSLAVARGRNCRGCAISLSLHYHITYNELCHTKQGPMKWAIICYQNKRHCTLRWWVISMLIAVHFSETPWIRTMQTLRKTSLGSTKQTFAINARHTCGVTSSRTGRRDISSVRDDAIKGLWTGDPDCSGLWYFLLPGCYHRDRLSRSLSTHSRHPGWVQAIGKSIENTIITNSVCLVNKQPSVRDWMGNSTGGRGLRRASAVHLGRWSPQPNVFSYPMISLPAL